MHIIFLLLLTLFPNGMYGQTKTVTNVIRDSLTVFPDVHILKINFVRTSVQERGWTNSMKVISKNEALQIIRTIDGVNITEEIDSDNKYLESVLVEVNSESSFKSLRDQVLEQAPYEIVHTSFEGISSLEKELIEKLVSLSKQKIKTQEGITDNQLVEAVKIEELTKESKTVANNESPEFSDVLNANYIEPHFMGYTIDKNGNIHILKEIRVTWSIR